MSKRTAPSHIRLRGVRHHNLKNFDLDLPLGRLIVVTGLSGSGKSTLAFDTLFAEGQRRYIETFSPYARQFFDRMDKPRVDHIEGIPPAIAIEQRNTVRTTRSTVGTMTEICDYLKLLWPKLAQLHCRQCGQPVRVDSPQSVWEQVRSASAPDKPRVTAGDQPPANAGSVAPDAEALITFDLPLSEKLSLAETLALIGRQGYQRLLVNDQIVRLEATPELSPGLAPRWLTIVQDRLKLTPVHHARFVEACEQAYHFGKGKLAVRRLTAVSGSPPSSAAERNSAADRLAPSPPTIAAEPPRYFSRRYHCAACDLEYREPSTALFSFNHPLGACPTCHGFGRTITIDYRRVLPDHSKTLAEGVVRPWHTGFSAECQGDLLKFCRLRGAPTKVPFAELPKRWRDWVVDGDPGYGTDKQHEWPRAWYGVKGYFRWLESKAYKMHVRVLLSRYRAYQTCPACHGQRFQPEALLYRVPIMESPDPQKLGAHWDHEPGRATLPRRRPRSGTAGPSHLRDVVAAAERQLRPTDGRFMESPGAFWTLADFYRTPIGDALEFIERLAARQPRSASDPMALVLGEVRARLSYLVEAGLGYLTLDRSTRTLSGGETERVNLTTCLGTRLVNTLFVLDEPSVGLHPRDTARLVRILERLRDAGNTVIVVEHEAAVIRAADQIVDLGPGHGETGGAVVFQGTYREALKAKTSLTGLYLSGRKRIEVPARRPVASAIRAGTEATSAPVSWLELRHVTRFNLRDLTVRIPLGRFVCVSGVSGSGKTTLVREVLVTELTARLEGRGSKFKVQNSKLGSKSDEADETETVENLETEPVGSATVATLSADRTPNLEGQSSHSDSETQTAVGRSCCSAGSASSNQRGGAAAPPYHGSGTQSIPVFTEGQPSVDPAGRSSGQAETSGLRGSVALPPFSSETPSAAISSQKLLALEGWAALGGVVWVDQSPLGKTPRSNPAVYLGAFDDIREVFARSEAAQQRGLNASAFSFNSTQGQCERCRGAGFEKIEMQFLSDVFIRCPDCDGQRYRPHILEVKIASPFHPQGAERAASSGKPRRTMPRRSAGRSASSTAGAEPAVVGSSTAWSIADLLAATVDETIAFLASLDDSRPARRAIARLRWLQEVGLGYLRLGQPLNTLSGGECQRLKLVSRLAEGGLHDTLSVTPFLEPRPLTLALSPGGGEGDRIAATRDSLAPLGERARVRGRAGESNQRKPEAPREPPTLFLFDEPTTGLHFDDVRVLLKVFQRLVDAGHSVLVIEHNLDVIKSADWIIDLGPEAGDAGGRIVVEGTPEQVAECAASHTGQALRLALEQQRRAPGKDTCLDLMEDLCGCVGGPRDLSTHRKHRDGFGQ